MSVYVENCKKMSWLLPVMLLVLYHINPIFIFLIAGLVKKYSQVLQRYYVQYLKGYDQSELTQVCNIPSLLLWKVFSGLNFKK